MKSRREVLAYGLAAAAGAWAFRRGDVLALNPWSRRDVDSYGRVRPASFSRPLPIPPVLEPARQTDEEDVYEIEVKPGLAQPLEGAPTPVLGLEGQWPGPTLVATRGWTLRLRLKNASDERISLHNHGLEVPADSDGHPVAYVMPGRTREYVYPNAQAGGTFWYHDHAFGLTGAHVYRGLAGMYLLRDPAEEALGLPSGRFDVPLVIQDRRFDAQNALVYRVGPGNLTTGFLGDSMCVNGVHTPKLEVEARPYRFRVLNASNSRALRLALSNGGKLVQIASDGALLEAPLPRVALDLAPAERVDVVVDFSQLAPGTSVVLKNQDETWPVLADVMRFDVVAAKGGPVAKLPLRLARVERLDEREARARRTFRFQLQDGKWTINGLRYDPTRVDIRPKLGSVEVWTLHNAEATQMHPFHQHLVHFQVLDLDGAPPPPELRGWKDTVAVGPGSTVRVAMRFTGYKGLYVFHCHKLEHEDHAMMLQQLVVG